MQEEIRRERKQERKRMLTSRKEKVSIAEFICQMPFGKFAADHPHSLNNMCMCVCVCVPHLTLVADQSEMSNEIGNYI